jgi:signal peptidase I
MPTEEDILRSINSSQAGRGGEYDRPNPEDNISKSGEVWSFIWETIKIIIISLAIIVPIRYYLVQPFFVKGASMETNFHDGDYLLIDEISYRFNEPKRGDVIVFHYPKDPSDFFIKRIVGLPNETVEVKNNKVTVYNSDFPKGLVLKEDYLSLDQQTLGNHFVKLGEDEYYVLGDNRLQSSDSRSWGALGENFITGKVFIRLWPFSNITKMESVNY